MNKTDAKFNGNLIDLTGQKFGRLQVLKRNGAHKNGDSRWDCQCECGKITNVIGYSLRKGKTLSCGCLARESFMKNKMESKSGYKVDLTNQKFGKLLVQEYLYDGKQRWKCICDCGNTTYVRTEHLKSKTTVSCGCHRKEKNYGNQYGKKYSETEAAWRLLYASYRTDAKDRNYVYEITLEQFVELASKNCHYCDEMPEERIMKNGRDRKYLLVTNGIDRIDNEQGYTIENCVPCCRVCNKMKMDLPFEFFITKTIKIAEKFKIMTKLHTFTTEQAITGLLAVLEKRDGFDVASFAQKLAQDKITDVKFNIVGDVKAPQIVLTYEESN